MKFTCQRDILLNSINIVSKAVSTRTTLPILECILLKCDMNGLKLIANDLEIGIESAYIIGDIIEEGVIALEARIFSEIIRKVEGDTVTIDVDDNNLTLIKCGSSEFKIMGQDGEDFPVLPTVEKQNEYKLTQNDLRNMIRQTIFSIAQDDSKPILTGELIEIQNDTINMVSVDGYRISYRKSMLISGSESNNVIVPGKTLNEISKILSPESEENVSVYFTDKHILFDIGGNKVVSRIFEGEFIKYKQSFTEDYKTKVVIGRSDLISALERASLVSRDARKTPVRIAIKNDIIIITSKTEMGAAYEEVNIECEGEELVIAFNPKYLIDALKAIEDEKITIQFTTSLSPCIIRPISGDDYKYLILPLRM